jgi:Flp pilus assembly protein TadG
MPRRSSSTEGGGASAARSLREDEDGSAAIEFIFVGLLLLVPVVYLVVALGAIQGQSLGAEAGARHAARVFATAEDAEDARARADAVMSAVVREYGMDAEAVEVSVVCAGADDPCPRAGATVAVTVRTRVSLPLVPPVFGLERLASIPIEASSAQRVSRFWNDG